MCGRSGLHGRVHNASAETRCRGGKSEEEIELSSLGTVGDLQPTVVLERLRIQKSKMVWGFRPDRRMERTPHCNIMNVIVREREFLSSPEGGFR